ncbi:Hypothetical_protein [Hexamita inflata]|uniref:Hypothetical_protein n=1 Tax=Hexamita inflata TaxID=28002 RepID=A0AA86Q429_9EUKA|nr:Hypothetical protein HINF_LOCUS33307 [Hexamita inflata]
MLNVKRTETQLVLWSSPSGIYRKIHFKDLNRLGFAKIVIQKLLIYQFVTQLTNNQQSKVIRLLFISYYAALYEDLIKLNLSAIANFLGLINKRNGVLVKYIKFDAILRSSRLNFGIQLKSTIISPISQIQDICNNKLEFRLSSIFNNLVEQAGAFTCLELLGDYSLRCYQPSIVQVSLVYQTIKLALFDTDLQMKNNFKEINIRSLYYQDTIQPLKQYQLLVTSWLFINQCNLAFRVLRFEHIMSQADFN